MIAKLRKKFILLSMAALFVLLTVITVSINVITYRSVVSEADEILELLSSNNGSFPDFDHPGAIPLPVNMSPEIPYESRYFSVLIDKNGKIFQAEVSMIKAVDADEAIDLAEKVQKSGREQGFVENYRYKTYENGEMKGIVFLDWGRRIQGYRAFLIISICMTMAGFGLFFVVILFFSKRIVKPVAESYEKQKRFITDAGHELKTPLAIINADIDVLELDMEQNEWLEDMKKQTNNLAALTTDLVYLSKMEESEKEAQMIEFLLSDLVEDAAAEFRLMAKAQKKSFCEHIESMLTMTGNEESIRRLLRILLENALKYSNENGTIELCLNRNGKNINLTVFNTTETEIPMGSLPMIFDRFYRLEQSRNSQTGGSGIGLSIAKAIVLAHHGKIEAFSEDGKSLKITTIFPIKF